MVQIVERTGENPLDLRYGDNVGDYRGMDSILDSWGKIIELVGYFAFGRTFSVGLEVNLSYTSRHYVD